MTVKLSYTDRCKCIPCMYAAIRNLDSQHRQQMEVTFIFYYIYILLARLKLWWDNRQWGKRVVLGWEKGKNEMVFHRSLSSISHLTTLLSGCGRTLFFSTLFHLGFKAIKTGGSPTCFLHRQTLSGLFHLCIHHEGEWREYIYTAALTLKSSYTERATNVHLCA